MFADDDQERATQAQHAHMHVYWTKAGVTDRAQRLALTAAGVGREVATSADLTRDEADRLIRYMQLLNRHGVLALRAGEFLKQRPAVEAAPPQHRPLGRGARPSYLTRST